jgi:galactonate dehydratase
MLPIDRRCADAAPLKITELECFAVPPRWLFLKVSTDAGLVGWGEPALEGHGGAVEAAVTEAGEYLIGQDPGRIEDLWQVLYRGRFYRGGPVLMSAMAGIDQALWDLKGRQLGVPIYDLLGGAVRQKVRVYSWIGGDRPSDVAAAALARAASGFGTVKMNASEEMNYIDSYGKVEGVVARVAEVRAAVGGDFGIGIDFHGRIHKSMAKLIAKELEPYHPMFLEEPVLPENAEALREISLHTTIPIATGERLYSRWDFKHLLHDGYVDIVQPDPSHAGGISEVKRIASMAEAYDVALAPHCPLGPIALAACLQIDACTPNAFIQEESLGIHYNQRHDLLDYLVDANVFTHRDGYVTLPEGPGLGIEIDEEEVRRGAEVGHRWRNPLWRLVDGSVSEW